MQAANLYHLRIEMRNQVHKTSRSLQVFLKGTHTRATPEGDLLVSNNLTWAPKMSPRRSFVMFHNVPCYVLGMSGHSGHRRHYRPGCLCHRLLEASCSPGPQMADLKISDLPSNSLSSISPCGLSKLPSAKAGQPLRSGHSRFGGGCLAAEVFGSPLGCLLS